jgi:glycosyltransferase involved in cell wall biosynthesis
MSVYDGASYLEKSIESILNQTFKDFEFIIIDDGSTDNSWEILNSYANQDHRIKLFKNEVNLGLTKSLNKGLALAQGDYIARQDADDISLPQRFEKQVARLGQNSDIVLASCNIELIDAEGKPFQTVKRACAPALVAWYLLFYNHLAGHSQVMFRRKLVEELGGYSETYRYSQDYELWCRLSKVGEIAILPDVLLQQRRHGQSVSAEKRQDQEACVLTQTRYNIKQLIGEELSLQEVENLKRFWTGHLPSHQFPDSQIVNELHSRLKVICQEFLQQRIQQKNSDFDYHQLRIVIGQQFTSWANSLSIRRNSFEKIRILLYALNWHPLGVIDNFYVRLSPSTLNFS